MRGIAIGLFLCLLGTPIGAHVDAAILSVRDFGAIPNDEKEDTVGIVKALQAVQSSGDTVKLECGVYWIREIVVPNATGSLRGSGGCTILRRVPSAGPNLATFNNASRFTIRNLKWDINGTLKFGGVRFYSGEYITVYQTIVDDSNPQPHQGSDRYAYLFGRGVTPHQHIKFYANTISKAGVEIDYAMHVEVSQNVFRDVPSTAMLGAFSLSNGAIMIDYHIYNNSFVNVAPPLIAAVMVVLDPASTDGAMVRDIEIADNTFTYPDTVGTQGSRSIQIGTNNSSVASCGSTFDHLDILRNRIEVAAGADTRAGQFILANSSATARIVFDNLSIAENTLVYDGPKPFITVSRPGLNYVNQQNVVVAP